MSRPVTVPLIVAVTATVIVAAALAWGSHRWTVETEDVRTRLRAGRIAVEPASVDFRVLDSLPAPVQRFLGTVLKDGRPMLTAVHLRHTGTFNTGKSAEQWKSFRSDQLVILNRPGFDWSSRIAIVPGVPIRVRDAFVAGEGILHATLSGLITVADNRGAAMAEGELMRFLAEAMWYPTVLLPGQGVAWEAIDDRSARATLSDGPLRATLLFTFDDNGLVESVYADARGRMVGDSLVPTPWRGRFWNYEERNGMVVPLDGEVAWLIDGVAAPYWRGHIDDIVHEFRNE